MTDKIEILEYNPKTQSKIELTVFEYSYQSYRKQPLNRQNVLFEEKFLNED